MVLVPCFLCLPNTRSLCTGSNLSNLIYVPCFILRTKCFGGVVLHKTKGESASGPELLLLLELEDLRVFANDDGSGNGCMRYLLDDDHMDELLLGLREWRFLSRECGGLVHAAMVDVSWSVLGQTLQVLHWI